MTVRCRLSKALIRGGEYCFLGLGIISLGWCASVIYQAYLFQNWENERFEQALGGETYTQQDQFLASVSSVQPRPGIGKLISDLRLGVASEDLLGRSVVGRLEIPRLGLRTMVLEGVSQRILALAVGHVPGTAAPGQAGNIGLAGHRDTFFRGLRNIRQEDTITLRTLDGAYEYRVRSYEVVDATDTEVLRQSTTSELTLVTCYPFSYVGPAPERFVVHARRTRD